jgi:hypothetical protein
MIVSMTAEFPHLCGAIDKQTAKNTVRDKIMFLIASSIWIGRLAEYPQEP